MIDTRILLSSYWVAVYSLHRCIQHISYSWLGFCIRIAHTAYNIRCIVIRVQLRYPNYANCYYMVTLQETYSILFLSYFIQSSTSSISISHHIVQSGILSVYTRLLPFAVWMDAILHAATALLAVQCCYIFQLCLRSSSSWIRYSMLCNMYSPTIYHLRIWFWSFSMLLGTTSSLAILLLHISRPVIR
jgi:hypothetical protein